MALCVVTEVSSVLGRYKVWEEHKLMTEAVHSAQTLVPIYQITPCKMMIWITTTMRVLGLVINLVQCLTTPLPMLQLLGCVHKMAKRGY
jgi:hypothetical protein